MTNDKHYFKVTAKCGHVGRNFFIPKAFPIIAKNKKEASLICRNIPRVKHDHKDAILNCEAITKEEYNILRKINNNDPYLQCHSKYEQKNICNIKKDIFYEDYVIKNIYKFIKNKLNRKTRVEYKLLKFKILKDDMKKSCNEYYL